jgi:parallel beta-helix repeat protein
LKAGIYLAPGSNNCHVRGNVCGYDSSHLNAIGISLDRSSNNDVSGNCVAYSSSYGIYLSGSSNNDVQANSVSHAGTDGICVEASSNNDISQNTVSGSVAGSGIVLVSNSSNNSANNAVLSNNTRSNSRNGISLVNASLNNLSGNVVAENSGSGIALDNSSSNKVCKNNVSANRTGISLAGARDNAICLNNFIGNTGGNVTSVNSTNVWSTPQIINYDYDSSTYPGYLGNNWSGYTGKDNNSNGVGDSAYAIGSEADGYPLMKGFESYNVHPQANFEVSRTNVDEPLLAAFYDLSISYDGVTSWAWDFGDGATATSNEPSTSHQYAQDGVYTVSLTVREADGDSHNVKKTGYITVLDTNPIADFSATPAEGVEPLKVTFTEKCWSYDGIVTWKWDFGDGSTSNEKSPTHEYAKNGDYTVSLTVTEVDGDSNTATKPGYIKVQDTVPTADFSADKTTGAEPLTVVFAEKCTSPYDGLASWEWDFGDGTTSDQQNPTHVYAREGSYTVKLTVTETDGESTDVETKAGCITVSDTEPVADFSAAPTSAADPSTFAFADKSSSYDGIVSRSWDFGDGGAGADQNPSHEYAKPGTYTVVLTVREADGDTATKTVSITVEKKIAATVPVGSGNNPAGATPKDGGPDGNQDQNLQQGQDGVAREAIASEESKGFPVWIWAVIAVGVVLISTAVGSYIIIRRRAAPADGWTKDSFMVDDNNDE